MANVKTKLMLKTSDQRWLRVKIYHTKQGNTDINQSVNELLDKGLDSEGIQNVEY